MKTTFKLYQETTEFQIYKFKKNLDPSFHCHMHKAGTIYHSDYSTLNYLDNMPTHPPPNKEPHVSLNPVLRFPELHTAPSAHQLPILAAQTPSLAMGTPVSQPVPSSFSYTQHC